MPISVSVKKWVYDLLEREPPAFRAARQVRAAILILILMSVVALVLESVASVRAVAARWLLVFEVIAVATFSAEYLARLWSITENPRFRHPVLGRLRWAATPMAILDLLAVLPFYLPFVMADLRVLRLARIFRLARVAKLGRYSRAATMIGESVRERKHEMAISAAFIAVLMLISSSLIYYAENEAQPESFSSIPATMWWAIVTLTTVGYGDIVPVTGLGRLFAGLTAVLGIAMLALPTAILTSGLMERLSALRDSAAAKKKCPHCGGELP